MRATDQCTGRRCFKTNELLSSVLVCKSSYCKCIHHSKTPSPKNMYCIWYICLTSMVLCLFAVKQRRGLLMFSLPFVFYSFLWGLLWEKGKTARDSPTDVDHCVPEVSALELEIVLTLFSSHIPFLGILPPEYDHVNFRQALTLIFIEEC